MPQPHPSSSRSADGAIVLLRALAWVCAEPTRADRLLALTGLDPEELRNRAGEPEVLNALGEYLGAYEPDLIACAEALAIEPAQLASARA